MQKNVFKTKWLEFALNQFQTVFPNENRSDMMEFLEKEFEKDFTDHECVCYNNYEKEEFTSTLSNIIDWVEHEKPILTESGTFFKRHSIAYNPEGVIIQGKLDNRKIKKNEKFQYKKLAANELDKEKKAYYKGLMKKADLAQLRLKVSVNSIYGVSYLYELLNRMPGHLGRNSQAA